MPKTEIDYSNTIIYKITCKDSLVTDLYVGHTTNFVQRKHAHKQSCVNEKSVNYKCKLYEFIRNSGGWTNWCMEIINFYNCNDHYEARKKEQEYFVSLKATLNSIEPMPKPKIKSNSIKNDQVKKTFLCDICNITCANLKLFEKHNNTNKHIKMQTIAESNEEIPESCHKFTCEICDFNCCKQSNYEKHLLTLKHKNLINLNRNIVNAVKKLECEICHKIYKHASTLSAHKKQCKVPIEIIQGETDSDLKSLSTLVTELIKSNQILNSKMMEVCKKNNP